MDWRSRAARAVVGILLGASAGLAQGTPPPPCEATGGRRVTPKEAGFLVELHRTLLASFPIVEEGWSRTGFDAFPQQVAAQLCAEVPEKPFRFQLEAEYYEETPAPATGKEPQTASGRSFWISVVVNPDHPVFVGPMRPLQIPGVFLAAAEKGISAGGEVAGDRLHYVFAGAWKREDSGEGAILTPTPSPPARTASAVSLLVELDADPDMAGELLSEVAPGKLMERIRALAEGSSRQD